MDIDNIFAKLEGNADKLGALVGGIGGLQEHAWGKDVFAGINTIINGLITTPHIPNIQHVWQMVNTGQTFKSAVGAAIIGYLMKEVDIDPKLNRLGNALSKGGWGAAMGVVGLNLLVYAGAGHSEVVTANGGSRGNGNFWGGN